MSDSVFRPRRLILASSSPYRRALLTRLRLPFEVAIPALDETPHAGESARTTAQRLAQEKARAIGAGAADALIIGSDQVATFDGRQLGKPGTHAAALAQLREMRGRSVAFHTAVCLYDSHSERMQSAEVATEVRFRSAAELPDAVLNAYLLAEQPYDVAGSAKSEGLGITLLAAIHSDDPTALVGLPLIALTQMLLTAGYPILPSAPQMADGA